MSFITQGKTNLKPHRNPFGMIRGKYVLIIIILAVIIGGGIVSYYHWRNTKEVSICLEKYPDVVYKDCLPGQTTDGWKDVVLYPNTTDVSAIESQTDAFVPDSVLKSSVALYRTSHSTCESSWFIKNNGKLQKVQPLEFCQHIINYNSSCNDCLSEWEGSCC